MRLPATLLLPFLLLLSSTASAQRTSLSGTIMAPTGDSVKVWSVQMDNGRRLQKLLAAGALDKQGRFKLQFTLDSARSISFSDGSETTSMFMLPGEALQMKLHTTYFDESLHYSGDGADRNNALAALALADEIEGQDSYLYAYMAEPDSAALGAALDKKQEKMNALLDDLSKAYPEMAGLLADRKTNNAQSARWERKAIPEAVAFSTVRKEAIGKPAWDFKGVDVKGDTVRLSQFKGKTTVVDFWATWCGPCKAELPHWAELQKQYGDRINFVSVSIWDDLEKWKAMSADLDHQHGFFVSKELLGQLDPYKIRGIPRYMVIDKDLKIVTIDAPRPSSPDLLKYF